MATLTQPATTGPAPAPPTTSQAALAPVGPAGSDPTWTSWLPSTSWQAQLLTAMNWPITHTTVTAMDAWTLSEDSTGNLNGGNNPLAISGLFPGATRCLTQCGTKSPVMAYGTLQQGIQATVDFLNQNKGAYNSVFLAFQQADYLSEVTASQEKIGGKIVGNTGLLSDIFIAINQSGWCHKCQGGKYPVQLANLLNGIPLSAAALVTLGHAPSVDKLTGTPISGYSPSEQGAANPVGFASLVPGLSGLLGLLNDLTNGQFWLRLGVGVLGAALIIGGTVIFFESTGTGRSLTETAVLA